MELKPLTHATGDTVYGSIACPNQPINAVTFSYEKGYGIIDAQLSCAGGGTSAWLTGQHYNESDQTLVVQDITGLDVVYEGGYGITNVDLHGEL